VTPHPLIEMEIITVGTSDCKVSNDPNTLLVADALASCIAIAVHDPLARVAGLLHFMLPESGIDTVRARGQPCMFADTGISELFHSAYACGAEKNRMTVRVAGGPQLADSNRVSNIGKRNYLACGKVLWITGVMIHGQAVGGSTSRTVRMEGLDRFCVVEQWCWPIAIAGRQERNQVMSLRILVVDDSPVMRSFIKPAVNLSGLEIAAVHEAGDGVEALAFLQQQSVDIILTDINMPRMNGEELVRKLSECGLTSSIPTLVVSTDGTAARKENLSSLGARGYLQKPFAPEQLLEQMERVLGVAGAA
jgi:chemotaxis protein CheD